MLCEICCQELNLSEQGVGEKPTAELSEIQKAIWEELRRLPLLHIPADIFAGATEIGTCAKSEPGNVTFINIK
jgi:hypothetical protein